MEEQECDFIKASNKPDRHRKWTIGGVSLGVALLMGGVITWQFRNAAKTRAETLVENLLATPGSNVSFLMPQLQPAVSWIGTERLSTEMENPDGKVTRRLHAAYGLVELAPEKELITFLLDQLPKLPDEEIEPFVVALNTLHQKFPAATAEGRSLVLAELDRKIDSLRNSGSELHQELHHRCVAVALGLRDQREAKTLCQAGPDPKGRTALIQGLVDVPVDWSDLAAWLKGSLAAPGNQAPGNQALAMDPDVRSALCIAIGNRGRKGSEATGVVLEQLYQQAADAGTHSAARWALLQQGKSWRRCWTALCHRMRRRTGRW